MNLFVLYCISFGDHSKIIGHSNLKTSDYHFGPVKFIIITHLLVRLGKINFLGKNTSRIVL